MHEWTLLAATILSVKNTAVFYYIRAKLRFEASHNCVHVMLLKSSHNATSLAFVAKLCLLACYAWL